MEDTEVAVADMLQRNSVRVARVESNNGGRGFARAIQAKAPATLVQWFHQSGNKESRVLTNAPTVMQYLRFPRDWAIRWPQFYQHLASFKSRFAANKHDDAPDVLTGIIETEVLPRLNNGKFRLVIM